MQSDKEAHKWLYTNVQVGGGKVATGYIAGSTSSTTTVNCGFKPKYICVENKSTGNNFAVSIYDETVSTTQIRQASNSSYVGKVTLPSTTTNGFNSVTDTGFILNKISSSSWPGYYYFAIG